MTATTRRMTKIVLITIHIRMGIDMTEQEQRAMMNLTQLCAACRIADTNRQRRKYNQKRGTAYHYQKTGEKYVQAKRVYVS